jgi:hypothetical protein
MSMIASRALLKETPMRFKNNQSKLYVLESSKKFTFGFVTHKV